MSGHTGSDPAAYRLASEVEAQRARDPIRRAFDVLAAAGVDSVELEADRAEAAAEMQAAYREAAEAEFPSSIHALGDVQDVGSPRERAF
jgi:pyruvate dehydrogenase E1 component alpha subunit